MPINACIIPEGLHKIVRETMSCCRVFEEGVSGDDNQSQKKVIELLDGCFQCLAAGPHPSHKGSAIVIARQEPGLEEFCREHGLKLQAHGAKAGKDAKNHPFFGDGACDLHRVVHRAISVGILAHLNSLGWTDCGHMIDAPKEHLSHLLIHGIKPYSTVAITAEDPLDDDHPSVVASFEFKQNEISVSFEPNVSRITPVRFFDLCRDERDLNRFQEGEIIDLTEMHEGHVINAAARCTTLEGMESGLILAIAREPPTDFLNAVLGNDDNVGSRRKVGVFCDSSDFLTKQYLRQPVGEEGAENEGARGAIDDCRLFYVLRLGLPTPDGEENEVSPSRIGIVPSTNVCAGHTFLRGKGAKSSPDVAALFHADFEAALSSLSIEGRSTGPATLVPTHTEEPGEAGERAYTLEPCGPTPQRPSLSRDALANRLLESLSSTPRKVLMAPPTPSASITVQAPKIQLKFGSKPRPVPDSTFSNKGAVVKTASKPSKAQPGPQSGQPENKHPGASSAEGVAVPEGGALPPKKKAKSAESTCDISHEHWRNLVASGMISKSTIPDLKRFLGDNKKPVSGKKEQLIARVCEVLGMQAEADGLPSG